MKREEKFLISRRPYAVDLDTLSIEPHPRQSSGDHYYVGRIDAVWFRRRRGVTVAVIGSLWDYQDERPADGEAFLRAHDDGRYGGTAYGRWDGRSYWGDGVSLVEQEQHLAILRPMLENFPAIPLGYDGWWTFQ